MAVVPTFSTRPSFLGTANEDRDAPIVCAGVPFDIGTSHRAGARFGPMAIRGISRMLVDGVNPLNWRNPQAMPFADIGDFFHQPLKLYSSGMAARLAFAVCAHADADILIVDEALSVGDEAFGAKCDAFIRNFASHGTILLVSHDLETLQTICDRVIWIDDGVVQSMGAPKDVIARYREAIDGNPVPALAAGF